MYRTVIRVAAAAATTAICATLTPRTAAAQRSIRLGIAGGVAVPVGRADSLYSAGPAGMIAIVTGSTSFPIGLRLDYTYNQFHGRSARTPRTPDLHFSAVTADLIATLPTGYVKPYIIGGGGWYPIREPADGARHNEFGLNAGIGVAFPLFGAAGFLEARYHRITGPTGFADRRFVPVMLGVMF